MRYNRLLAYSVVLLNVHFLLSLIIKVLLVDDIPNNPIFFLIFITSLFTFVMKEFLIIVKPYIYIYSIYIFFILAVLVFYQWDFVAYVFNVYYKSNFISIVTSINAREFINPLHLQPFLILIVPIVSIFFYKLYTKYSLSLISILTISVISLWYARNTIIVSSSLNYFVFVFLYTLVTSIYKNTQKYKIINITRETNIYTIFTLAIILAFCSSITIFLLPKEIDLYQLAQNRFFLETGEGSSMSSQTSPYVNEFIYLSDFDIYNIKNSGFGGNNGSLGGPMTLNHTPVMTVNSNRKTYLRGATFDIYENNNWTKTNYITSPPIQTSSGYDIIFGDGPIRDISSKESLTIEYHDNFDTSTILAPLNIHNIDVDKNLFKNKPESTPSDALIRVEQGTYDIASNYYTEAPYKITYDVLHTSEGDLSEFIKVDHKNLPGFMSYSLSSKEYGKSRVHSYVTDIMNEDSSDINSSTLNTYSSFLQVPDNVPKEVYDLVNKITEGSSSSLEKVIRIKKYLYDNYEYSLEVNELPNDAEFISYFLFEEKKGYCVYFSTAMTIMCRIAGVPARYVEGFSMKEENKVDSNTYILKQSNAHSWCEVLAFPEDNIWIIADPLIPVEEELIFDSGIITDDITSTDSTETENTLNTSFSTNNMNYVFYIFGALMLLIVLTSLYIIIVYSINKYRIYKIKNSDTLLDMYDYCLKWLKELGIYRNDYESDLEFINGITISKIKHPMKKLILACYEEYYGEANINSIDKDKFLSDFHDILETYLGTCRYRLLKLTKLK